MLKCYIQTKRMFEGQGALTCAADHVSDPVGNARLDDIANVSMNQSHERRERRHQEIPQGTVEMLAIEDCAERACHATPPTTA